jgi:peptide/nickel transport system substrate-binding protein
MTKRISILAALLMVATLMMACGGRGERATRGGAGGGRELVIALDNAPTHLDSRVGNDSASGRLMDLIYAGLVKFTPEAGHDPDLAERWEISEEQRTITFHLRPNLTFQDGRPLTARDVLFTYQSLMAEDFDSPKKSGYTSVTAFEAPDDRTFVIRFSEINAGMLDNLTLGIVPEGANAEQFRTQPIGAGPYKVTNFIPDDRVVMEAFAGYHGGAPAIGQVVARVVPDATTRVLELRRGSINFALNAVPLDAVAAFKNNDEYDVIAEPGSIYQYLAFNLREPHLRNEKVRQAIAHAIDRNRIVSDLLLGYGEVTNSMLPTSHWSHTGDLPDYPFDQARAKALLDEAGFRDPDGDGPQARFALTYSTSTDAEANQQAQMIQQMLKQVGIEITINSKEFSTFYDDIQNGRYDMFSLRRAGVSDPDFYSVILASDAMPPEGQNRGFYSNPRVDQLLAEARSTFDQSRRTALYQQVQQIVARDLPYVSLYHRSNIAIMNKDLEGFEMYPAGFLLSIADMRWDQ